MVVAAREVALRDSAAVDFLHVWSPSHSLLPVASGYGEVFMDVADIEKTAHEEEKNYAAAQARRTW